jgi:hypothetical protein
MRQQDIFWLFQQIKAKRWGMLNKQELIFCKDKLLEIKDILSIADYWPTVLGTIELDIKDIERLLV